MHTLGLNMIVGAGDAQELRRCLESFCAKKFFNEIVIVATTLDENVIRTAKEFTENVLYKEFSSQRYPNGDFAGARNYAIEYTKSDYIMWLDADDVLEEKYLKSMMKIKNVIQDYNFDYYFMKYRMKDKIEIFSRPRIFKNDKSLRWQYPVHEQLTINGKHQSGTFNGLFIDHAPVKSGEFSINRNIKIIEHENEVAPNKHINFFYTKELICLYKITKDESYKEKAIELMKGIIEERLEFNENMAVICINLAMQLLYDIENDSTIAINKENLQQAETFARIAMSYSGSYAEPFCFLGDIRLNTDRKTEAINFYKEAMKKKMDAVGTQQKQFYEEIPARRLVEAYHSIGNLELALYYSSLVLQHCHNDEYTKLKRKELLGELIKNG